MPTRISTAPFQAAIDRLAGKVSLPSPLRTAEWAEVPTAITERAFFSAGVERLHTLESMRAKLLAAVSQQGATFMDRSKFVAEMRGELGAIADGTLGSLTDLSSIRRLQLIYDWQVEDAHAYGPAQEFLRVEGRENERQDWPARWAAAGGKFFDGGRMIATKDDPVWTKLSRFGRPWPPFDFGSGMGMEDIHRSEAEALGVIPQGKKIEVPEKGFNESLKASTAGLSADAKELFSDLFQGRVNFVGDAVELGGDA